MHGNMINREVGLAPGSGVSKRLAVLSLKHISKYGFPEISLSSEDIPDRQGETRVLIMMLILSV